MSNDSGRPGAIDTDSVQAWRTEMLVAAGYPEEEALLLGRRTDIDVHVAVDLLRNGCSVSLAIRILT